MSESTKPEKKTKLQLEQLVKANGGKIFQTKTAASDMICISGRSKPLLCHYE
jgi:DNA ligase-4